MTATLKGISATASATSTAIYTATTSTAVLSIIGANIGGSTADVTVFLYRADTAVEKHLIKGLGIPSSSNANMFNGKVILNPGDELRLSGSPNIEVHVALSEVS